MAIPAGTKFHGLAPRVETQNRGSKQSNSQRDAYAIEDFKLAEASVEDVSVSGTYEIDLSVSNHELIVVGNTTLGVTSLPEIGQSIVVTVYMSIQNTSVLTIPGAWNRYGVDADNTGLRNQLVLSVSNNLQSGVVFDLSISVQI